MKDLFKIFCCVISFYIFIKILEEETSTHCVFSRSAEEQCGLKGRGEEQKDSTGLDLPGRRIGKAGIIEIFSGREGCFNGKGSGAVCVFSSVPVCAGVTALSPMTPPRARNLCCPLLTSLLL